MSMNKNYTTVTIDGIEYQVPDAGNPEGVKFERSYKCHVCGLEYRESDIRFFRGAPYGIPCGCANDIPSIIRLEQGVEVPEDGLHRGDR